MVDGTVLLYDLASPQSPIYTIGSNNSHVDQIRFHLPSQQFLIYRRKLLSLWNFVKRKKIWQTDQVVGSIQSIQFDQTGQLVAVLSRNQILVYTNQSSTSSKSNRLAIAVCEGRTDPFLAFCFGPSDALLPVQKIGQISQWGISKQSSKIREEIFSEFIKVSNKVLSPVRKFGSAALDIAYVASGRFDGYWQRELNYWDIAAGIIILKEAGGLIDFFEPDNKAPIKKNILASNSNIHQKLSDLIIKKNIE